MFSVRLFTLVELCELCVVICFSLRQNKNMKQVCTAHSYERIGNLLIQQSGQYLWFVAAHQLRVFYAVLQHYNNLIENTVAVCILQITQNSSKISFLQNKETSVKLGWELCYLNVVYLHEKGACPSCRVGNVAAGNKYAIFFGIDNIGIASKKYFSSLPIFDYYGRYLEVESREKFDGKIGIN